MPKKRVLLGWGCKKLPKYNVAELISSKEASQEISILLIQGFNMGVFLIFFKLSRTSLNDCRHSHKKRKFSLETQTVLLIFLLKLEISQVAVQRIHQNSKKWWLSEEFLSGKDFEAVLATSCCQAYGANASDTVQKIASDHKDDHKCSSCVIVCWKAEKYQSITLKKFGYFLTRTLLE